MTREQKKKLRAALEKLREASEIICNCNDVEEEEYDALSVTDQASESGRAQQDVINLLDRAADSIGWAINDLCDCGIQE